MPIQELGLQLFEIGNDGIKRPTVKTKLIGNHIRAYYAIDSNSWTSTSRVQHVVNERVLRNQLNLPDDPIERFNEVSWHRRLLEAGGHPHWKTGDNSPKHTSK